MSNRTKASARNAGIAESGTPIRTAVVYIFKAAFGGADAFAPVAQELATSYGGAVTLDFVFLDRRARKEVAASRFHDALFAKLGRIHDLSKPPRSGRWYSMAWKTWRLFGLLIGHRFRGRHVAILYSASGRGVREQLLLGILRLIGRQFWFPSIQPPWSPRMAARMMPETYARLVEADTGRLPRVRGSAPRDVLCYTDRERLMIEGAFSWGANYHAIGVPRLFESWSRVLAELGDPLLEEELESLGLDPATSRFATVVLTAPGYIWYDTPNRYFELLRDAIAELAVAFPGEPILLKAKPSFAKVYAELGTSYENTVPLRLTTMGLAVLARRTSVAITINESSGFFDFVVAGIPTIEYASYNARWLNLVGTTSAWEGVPGLQMVETREALARALKWAKEGAFPVADVATLAAYFGHRRNLAPLVRSVQ